jgi:hypothetical protein
MRKPIAVALLALTATLARHAASADELRLWQLNEHRLVIEGPFGGTRGYVRAHSVLSAIIENSWGRGVGAVRPLPGGERAIVDCGRRRGCLEVPD